jgi:hypothetical protein
LTIHFNKNFLVKINLNNYLNAIIFLIIF